MELRRREGGCGPVRLPGVLAAALVLPLLAGCGGSGGAAPASATGAAPAQGASGKPSGGTGDSAFRSRDLVISAGCTVPASRPARVRVEGFDPATWKKVASAEFTLPAQVVIDKRDNEELSALYSLCAENFPQAVPDDGANVSDQAFGPRVRQLFDQDFTRLAVVTADGRTGATHVGFVDRAGKLTDLTGDGGGFATTPKEQDALFAPDGGSVWFSYLDATRKQHIASRSVSGSHRLTDQWAGDRAVTLNHVLVLGGAPLHGVIGDRPYFSPDGRRTAGFVYGHGQSVVPVAASGVLPAGGTVLENPDSDCLPSGWVDNHTLLCSYRDSGPDTKHLNNIWTVDVDRIRPRDSAQPQEADGPNLLPVTDRTNLPVAVSPDGRRVLFRSLQGQVEHAYVTDLTPGAQPRQITSPDAATPLATAGVVIEWR